MMGAHPGREAAQGISKPLRQLIETSAILALVLLAAVASLAFLKQIFDRRILEDVALRSKLEIRRLLAAGETASAEGRLIDLFALSPELASETAWEFIDSLAIMPQLEHELAGQEVQGSDDPASPLRRLQMEIALRTGRTKGLSLTDGYRAWATLEWEGPAALKPDLLERAAQEPLPEGSLARKLFPTEPADRGDAYAEGLAAFYAGRWAPAEEKLAQDQALGRADAAYRLGAIKEAQGQPAQARAWYERALASGAPHLGAATGLLRLARE